MVHETIAYRRFVDVAGLGVGDFEGVIGAVLVRPLFQLAMESEDVVHETVLEFLDIALVRLAALELFPRGEEIFY